MKVPAIFILAVMAIAAAAFCLLHLTAHAAEAGEEPDGEPELPQKVLSVEVFVEFAGADIRPIIAGEIQTAIEEVVELALLVQLEGDLATIAANKDEISETLLRVIDLTLDKRGFKTDSLSLTPGEIAIVELEISVTGESIADVRVEFVAPAKSGLSDALLFNLQNELSANLRRKFFGLPSADKKWLTGLFAGALAEEFAASEELGMFNYRMELLPSTITRVVLYLTNAPGERALDRRFLRTRSSTILNLSLDSAREAILVELAGLAGLPARFVELHRDEAADYLESRVKALGSLAFYEPEVEIEFAVRGGDLFVTAIIESRRYRTAVSGRVDFDREVDNPRIDGIIGMRMFSSAEVYAAVKFFPDSVDFEPEIGLGINPRPGVFVGGGWDFDREAVKLRGNVWLGAGLVIHAEHYTSPEFNEDGEYGITYFFTKDFSVSAFADGDGSAWMALGVKL